MPPKKRVPGAKIKRERMTEKQVRDLKPASKQAKLTTYALPFRRKGQKEPEWRRFTLKQLTQFLNEYKDDDEERAEWRRYAVRETWTFPTKIKRDEFRHDTDLYFYGRRISEPSRNFVRVHANASTKGADKAKGSRKRRGKRK